MELERLLVVAEARLAAAVEDVGEGRFALRTGKDLGKELGAAGIRLQEAVRGAHVLEFGGEEGEFGQLFVDKADLFGQLLIVNPFGQIAPEEAW